MAKVGGGWNNASSPSGEYPMRILMLALAFVALPSQATVTEAVQVEVRPVSADGYELRVVLPAAVTEAQAQAALQPVADKVCQGRRAQLGRYRFEATDPVATGAAQDQAGTQTFSQQMQCVDGDALPAPPPGQPAPKTPPSDDDKRTVTEQTLAYLSAKDRDDFTAVRAMLDSHSVALLSSPEALSARIAFNQAAGEPKQRQVVRLTWYDDPAGAPRLGRYVAADYRGDFAHAGFYCGYAVWLLQPDGQFRIVRSEEGTLAPADAEAIAPENIAATRAQLGCRD